MNGMIAFDYYDGVLEGVCRDLHGMREAYFTLIAWDEEVDGRIFATVEITEGTIQALADVLSRTHPFPEREVWTPRNRPGDPDDAAFIEALIAEARHRIRTEGMLLRAFQIESVPVRSRRVVKSDLARIDRMLASGKYDTIVGWFNP